MEDINVSKFDLLWAMILGIFGYIIGALLIATEVFSPIENLHLIGLLLGFLCGGFRDKLGITFGQKKK